MNGPIEPVEDRIHSLSTTDLERLGQHTLGPANGVYEGPSELWEQDALPVGMQDNALIGIAGYMRREWRFSEQGIFHTLSALIGNGTLERDAVRRPYNESDVRRIARSAANYPVGEPSYEVTISRIICDVPLVGGPLEWWVHGFIPQAELVMLYGRKASGKSTFGSWLASEVTQKGGTILHVGVEEPYARFRVRSILGGAVPERILGWRGSLRLPEDVDALEEQVLAHRISLVYFDSIYTHFTAPRGTLENTRARSNLEPLAQMAQRTGATVLANFHNRRSDDSYMGSTEMINVARVILRLERRAHDGSRLYYETGNYPEPNHALRFLASSRTVADPQSGEVQMERQLDGTLAPMSIQVVTSVEQVPINGGALSSDLEPSRQASLIEAV